MITSVSDERIKRVNTTDEDLVVTLFDDRTLTTPLSWYPRLLRASKDQREDWRTTGAGYGIHWPQIDEDISVEGMLRGIPAPGGRLKSSPSEEHLDQYVVSRAQDFYGQSIGSLKAQVQNYRSQLEQLFEQLPEGDTKAQIQEMIDSYMELEDLIDQTAQDQGVEDTMNQATEATEQQIHQGQQQGGGAAQQAQQAAGQAAQQASGGQQGLQQPNATQAAQQKAQELGVDLSQVQGSGAGGRITVRDMILESQE